MQKKLLEWYEEYGRHSLPWRNTSDIYHIYLSEIMLQQTQVNRVQEEYYPQFLAKFPTLKSLAEAPLDEVLASWSGLGYYSRARNLHATAKLVSEQLPSELKELVKLPGIGRYTASAICSFGHKQNVPVVDTNIARVIKRVFALLEPQEKQIWEKAEILLNEQAPREHNLALMDLGSMICVPKNPNCNECPLSFICAGKNEPELYTQVKKKEYEAMDLFYGLLVKENQIALKMSDGPMYKNMLELPSVEPIEENLMGVFKHSYTKYRLSVHLYELQEFSDNVEWYELDKIENAPISSLTKKALKFIK
ncbi:A/G-specific adenine glycosylase [Sulfurimonas sp. C5]|uniref:A/G-specific adenine glycosylase n=1 Tax=Sulfurimonas sp. C5 TaxID=3036947 RepID=UPI0024567AD5|nr:A/G-specific adenine glycosylase [Sulfurimonas sp. C5]MDH4945026.1 A/G-specific adenine glycosylase [Sulfurimonas sp. C5]